MAQTSEAVMPNILMQQKYMQRYVQDYVTMQEFNHASIPNVGKMIEFKQGKKNIPFASG